MVEEAAFEASRVELPPERRGGDSLETGQVWSWQAPFRSAQAVLHGYFSNLPNQAHCIILIHGVNYAASFSPVGAHSRVAGDPALPPAIP